MTQHRIGVMYDRAWEPEGLPGFARAVEALGIEELWVVEDLGWTGAMSSAAAALGATDRLRVGIGIAPAPLRNPALLAMELAALARMFPGRLTAGVGHGVGEWMAKVGAAARSPLALLEETLTVVRGLLRGERVTLDGREVRVDGVQLVHPPVTVPPLVAGVVRPRSLELSGRVADGTLLPEGQGPDDVAAALAHIGKGRTGERPHSLTTFTFLSVDSPGADPAAGQAVIAGQAAWLGRPADQIFAASGSPEAAAAAIRALWAAGVGTVVLRPLGPQPLRQLAAAQAALRQPAA
ncbi:LLM class flavin-dependent oxidoreductase [Streptacidiphilus sp. P02-A3a]|uniref:LLM class flavin-dependent oxidoreductase n=1 Tax=Streptacidiphilus sp. P02-A3a TaxID=2704468 RepID=UPI0015F8B106|nr:LLM class flavin-dependent oxidoreductase [Streptacidiphilus sp. P02-A3a]QMU68205.1 LLM class flavin-dependent oxidoreductase [Streptacidiphilus sp. P02-A3a]